jgi:hypothetical protein
MLRRGTLVLALLALGGCRGDDAAGPRATLDNLWPSADGTFWTYEMRERNWDLDLELYPDPAQVPPPPTLDEIVALLEDHPTGEPIEERELLYRVEFDGVITTESGATGQHLVSEITDVPGARLLGASSAPGRALLSRIFAARPDLREALGAERRLAAGDFETVPAEPLFVSGYAWEKTFDWIGGYGDLDTELSWKYLEADLGTGHEFVFQLVPSVTDNIFLHFRILGRRSVETGVGTIPSAVECLYLVDFGIFELTDENGVVLGYGASYEYGTVLYAPEIGPVASYERRLVARGSPPSDGRGDITLVLKETNADDVPGTRAGWMPVAP